MGETTDSTTDEKVTNTRPVHYSQEWADRFCALISNGKSLKLACKPPTMPAPKTIFEWLRKYPEFNSQYGVACEERAKAMAEDILDIADNATNDFMEDKYMKGKTPGYQLNGENIQRSRLRVDTRKWLMSKTLPKKFGEKLDLTTNGKDLPTPILGGIAKRPTLNSEVNDVLSTDDSNNQDSPTN